MAVELDGIAVGDAHAAADRSAADVVAAEVEQHQMLGAFLGIGEQAVAILDILGAGAAARAGAGDRTDGDLAVADPDENLGRRADQREARQVEKIEEDRKSTSLNSSH